MLTDAASSPRRRRPRREGASAVTPMTLPKPAHEREFRDEQEAKR